MGTNTSLAAELATRIIVAALENDSFKLKGCNGTAATPEAAAEHDGKYLAALYKTLWQEIAYSGDK